MRTKRASQQLKCCIIASMVLESRSLEAPQSRIIFTMSLTIKAHGHPSADFSESDLDTEEIVTPMTPQDLDILSQCYKIHIYQDSWDGGDEERTALDFNPGPCSDESVLINWTDDRCERFAVDLRQLILQNCSEMTYSSWVFSLLPPDFNKKNIALGMDEVTMKTSKFELPKPSSPNSVELSTWGFRSDWLFFYTNNALNGVAFDTWHEYYGTVAGRRATIALNAELMCEKGDAKLARAQALAAAALVFKQRLDIRRAAGGSDNRDLKHYFCIFKLSVFELYRMTVSSDGVLETWRLRIPRMDLSTGDGIRAFIDVWNNLMAELVGPCLASLVEDLKKIHNRGRQTRTSRRAGIHKGLS